MELYVLGVALAALAIAVIALVRTSSPRDPVSPLEWSGGPAGLRTAAPPRPRARFVDVGRTPAGLGTARGDDPTASQAIARPLRDSGGPYSRLTISTEWFLRVVPRASAVAAVAIVVVTFALQNLQLITVRFLDWGFDRVPLAVAILASGIVAGSGATTLALLERRRLLTHIHRLERLLESCQSGRPAQPYVHLLRTGGSRSPRLGGVGPGVKTWNWRGSRDVHVSQMAGVGASGPMVGARPPRLSSIPASVPAWEP